MAEETKTEQDRVVKLLEEILKWIKVTSIPQVKQLLETTLTTPEQKLAYHYSTGRPRREIATEIGVHDRTISEWWNQWIKLGIAEAKKVRGGGERGIRSFSLEDFGIEIPKIKQSTELGQKKSCKMSK